MTRYSRDIFISYSLCTGRLNIKYVHILFTYERGIVFRLFTSLICLVVDAIKAISKYENTSSTNNDSIKRKSDKCLLF